MEEWGFLDDRELESFRGYKSCLTRTLRIRDPGSMPSARQLSPQAGIVRPRGPLIEEL